MFLIKGVLKICSKFPWEDPCQSVISIKLLCNFIEMTLRHWCPPVNSLHVFRTSFPKNTSGWLLLWNFLYHWGCDVTYATFKLCNFITSWEHIKTPQNAVQSSFSLKPLNLCHKKQGWVFGLTSPSKLTICLHFVF